MKKIIFIILLSVGSAVQAQQKTNLQTPINGFWVIESNFHSPKKQTIKFYNHEQQLLYQENYDYKVLKCLKKDVRRMLDSSLVTVLKYSINPVEVTKLANIIRRNY